MVGLVHPCKIYNLLNVSVPLLYIGPPQSHLSEILDRLGVLFPHAVARHGEVQKIVAEIRRLRQKATLDRPEVPSSLRSSFSKKVVLPMLVAQLQACAGSLPSGGLIGSGGPGQAR